MKKRTGFVSNSSSSSFIIAAKPKQSLRANIKTGVDVSRFIDISITNLKELEQYYIDQYCWEKRPILKEALEEEDRLEEYKERVALIESGYFIYLGSTSNENGDDGVEMLLCEQGINVLDFEDEVLIIEGEGGY